MVLRYSTGLTRNWFQIRQSDNLTLCQTNLVMNVAGSVSERGTELCFVKVA